MSHQGLTEIPASQGYTQDEEYVREVTLQAVPVAFRIEEIEEHSVEDEDKAPKDFTVVRNELTYIGQIVLLRKV